MNIYPENALILAPLSGYTDIPYRRSANRHGCLYAFTEMIDAGSLVFGNRKTLRFLERSPDEKWLGAQIVGSDTETLSKSAKIISQYDFNILDFNLGCPAPKVQRKGEGAALAKEQEKALRAFSAIRQNYSGNVSAKIRLLDENDPSPTIKLIKDLRDAGASVITVHGRVAKQFYSGPVHYQTMKAVKESVGIQIVANGGINSFLKYTEVLSLVGNGAVMFATGAMGNPWIFEEILNGDSWIPPTPEDISNEIKEHIYETCKYYGNEIGLRISRKFIFDYLKGRGYSSALKNSVVKVSNFSDFEKFLCEIRKGPSEGYFKWLEKNPNAPRRIRLS
ncbi:MAG TPA: tRNA-dihydrouridine synthase family protein [Victivallales bacterium]|nr:tRNA-dihydrouridine synthase family protein [Victivallales bacterium]